MFLQTARPTPANLTKGYRDAHSVMLPGFVVTDFTVFSLRRRFA